VTSRRDIKLYKRLRDAGFRPTPQRLAVYECLLDMARQGRHPDVEELYHAVRRNFPTISRATVRRTLDLLAGLGLARRITFPGDAGRYDGDAHPHVHLRCVDCGTVTDIHVPELPDLLEVVAARSGFLLTGHTLVFTGLCPGCRSSRREAHATQAS